MKNKKLWIALSFVVILFPLLLGALLWNQIPDPMPTHWGADGKVNGYSSRTFGVLFMPLFMAAMQVFILVVCFLDPKGRRQIESSRFLFLMVVMIIPATTVFTTTLTYGTVLGYHLDVAMISQIFLGGLYLLLGNYLPKIQQNYTVGVRLPWTLESKDNWKKTNRIAGYMFVICGILFILNGIFHLVNLLVMVLGSTFVILIGIGVFSVKEYHKEQEKDADESDPEEDPEEELPQK